MTGLRTFEGRSPWDRPSKVGQRLSSCRTSATVSLMDPADTAHVTLWEQVRVLHADLSAYDAQYVALAESLGAPLITCDARIKRSGAAKCHIGVFSPN